VKKPDMEIEGCVYNLCEKCSDVGFLKFYPSNIKLIVRNLQFIDKRSKKNLLSFLKEIDGSGEFLNLEEAKKFMGLLNILIQGVIEFKNTIEYTDGKIICFWED
jgi:hypothetical protein